LPGTRGGLKTKANSWLIDWKPKQILNIWGNFQLGVGGFLSRPVIWPQSPIGADQSILKTFLVISLGHFYNLDPFKELKRF